MGVISDRFARLTVRTSSEDGSVTVTMKQAGGIRVEIEPGMRDRHTERSLETALSQVLAAAVYGYNKGVTLICEQIPVETTAADPHTPSGKRRAAYLDKLADIEASVESPLGYVELTWNGQDDIRVELEGSPHSRLSEEALASEVNAALDSVIRQRNIKVLKSHEEVYQFHRFGKRSLNDARK